jgi:RNA polymerase sigma-70 factor (family 1)
MYSLNSLPDCELLDLLRSGERDAFVEIYNRYWKKILAVAYNHTKDKAVSQEVVQQVFVSLWDRRELVSIGSIGGYLATAAKFTIFKYRAAEQRHRELSSNFYHPSSSLDDQQIDARFLQEFINGIVETLPEKCRLVFKYSRVEQMSIREIAQEMGIAEKTAEAHLTKALKTLKLSLKQAGLLSLLYLFS